MSRFDWHEQALCADPVTAEADFFPENRRSARAKLAKQFCGVCPVRSQCLDWALAYEEPWGIFGGTDPKERRWLKDPTVDMEDSDASTR